MISSKNEGCRSGGGSCNRLGVTNRAKSWDHGAISGRVEQEVWQATVLHQLWSWAGNREMMHHHGRAEQKVGEQVMQQYRAEMHHQGRVE
jgi:hypothetical protein